MKSLVKSPKSARGKIPGRRSLVGGLAALLLLGAGLSGCIVEPIGGGYHHFNGGGPGWGGGSGWHHSHWNGGGWGH
jgi:hypothetical protein